MIIGDNIGGLRKRALVNIVVLADVLLLCSIMTILNNKYYISLKYNFK